MVICQIFNKCTYVKSSINAEWLFGLRLDYWTGSRIFPKFTDHTQKFPKSYRVPAKILRKCVDENITKIPRKSADKLLLVVHLLILVGKHQTELTVKLYICGSEKAQKFAGSLPKF